MDISPLDFSGRLNRSGIEAESEAGYGHVVVDTYAMTVPNCLIELGSRPFDLLLLSLFWTWATSPLTEALGTLCKNSSKEAD